jgi:hypothetical protein
MENSDILIDTGLILSYVMIGSAALASIVFGIIKMMQDTNNAKKTLYWIGGLVISFIIAYVLASDEVLDSYKKYEITASTAKQVGMGLITCYILAIGAIGAIFYAELSKVFSK